MSTIHDQTISELTQEIAEMEDEIIQTKRVVNRLCLKAGREPIYPSEGLKSSDQPGSMRNDQFYGLPLATAIKAVLQYRRTSGAGAATVNEIYSMLIKGGYKFETDNEDNAKRGLRISLQKNIDFHKLPHGGYGLTEWYPRARSENSERKQESNKTNQPPNGSDAEDTEDRQTEDDI